MVSGLLVYLRSVCFWMWFVCDFYVVVLIVVYLL